MKKTAKSLLVFCMCMVLASLPVMALASEEATQQTQEAPRQREEGQQKPQGGKGPGERPEGLDANSTPPEKPEGEDGQEPPEKPEGEDGLALPADGRGPGGMGGQPPLEMVQEAIDGLTDTDVQAQVQALLDAYEAALAAEKELLDAQGDETALQAARETTLAAQQALQEALEALGIAAPTDLDSSQDQAQ